MARCARHPASATPVPSPSTARSPAEGHGTKGVAPLVLEQAGAKLGQAAEEEAKRDGQLGGALGLCQMRLGALEQGGGEGEAIQAQGRCGGEGGGGEWRRRQVGGDGGGGGGSGVNSVAAPTNAVSTFLVQCKRVAGRRRPCKASLARRRRVVIPCMRTPCSPGLAVAGLILIPSSCSACRR